MNFLLPFLLGALLGIPVFVVLAGVGLWHSREFFIRDTVSTLMRWGYLSPPEKYAASVKRNIKAGEQNNGGEQAKPEQKLADGAINPA